MTRHLSTVAAIALGALLYSSPALQAQNSRPAQDPKPAPEVTAVTPTELSTSPRPRALAFTGRYFQDGLAVSVTTPGGAVLEYKNTAITDRRDTSFNAMIVLAEAGPYEFVVVNPDGRTSSPFKVQVRIASQLPVVSGVRPPTLNKGASPQTITVDGQRFMLGLSVLLTDPIGNVRTIPSSDVSQVLPNTFQITVSLDLSGNYEIIVKNPDGGISRAFTFSVQR